MNLLSIRQRCLFCFRVAVLTTFSLVFLSADNWAEVQLDQFSAPIDYIVGDAPYSMFTGDLDGDLDIDVAVANSGYPGTQGSVTIMLNDGCGGFVRSSDIAAGLVTTSICGADFDLDGDLDLVVANQHSGTISVWQNDGSGTFGSRLDYSAGSGAFALSCSDLDGDMDPDIVVACYWADVAVVFENDGTGQFSKVGTYDTGDQPVNVVSADFDRDGDQDLAVAVYRDDQLLILLNSGAGVFDQNTTYPCGDGTRYICASDLDGDGDIDLAVAEEQVGGIHIFINDGTANFSVRESMLVGMNLSSIACADFDHDTDYDLLVTDPGTDLVYVLENVANSSFGPPIDYDLGPEPFLALPARLNCDNLVDLVLARGWTYDAVSVIFNQGVLTIPVALDIKPGSCPNPFNVKPYVSSEGGSQGMAAGGRPDVDRLPARGPKKSVLPAAILGSADFDVSQINPATVLLNGVALVRYSYEDVTTPADQTSDACACNEIGGDGYEDMTLKFYRDDIVASLGDVADGDIISLTVTGELYDGTPIEGSDCIVIIYNDKDDDKGNEMVVVANEPPSSSNYPNPFNPTTEISFSLPDAGHVTLEVFNIVGQRIEVLVDGTREAGHHVVEWDAGRYASGVYLYRLTAGDFVETRRMVLVK